MLQEGIQRAVRRSMEIEERSRTFRIEILQRAIDYVSKFAEKEIGPAPNNIVPLSKPDVHFEKQQKARLRKHLAGKQQYADLMSNTAIIAEAIERARSNGQKLVELDCREQFIVSSWIQILSGTLNPGKDFAGRTVSSRQKIAILLEKSFRS